MFVAGVLTTLAVLAGLWLAQRLTARLQHEATAELTATPTRARPTASATPTVHTPPGYRLAGVAVNADQLYAAIESPDGSNALYRQNDEVPGLGRIKHVGPERAVISTTGGEITLLIMPAATLTPTLTRHAATATPRRAAATPAAWSGASSPAATP